MSCRYAASHGYLDALQYLHENGYKWDVDAYIYAARNGHLECLKYLHENNCPRQLHGHTDVCSNAASNGHLECLKYLHEKGFPWDYYTGYCAALKNHVEILEYLHENGCPCRKIDCEYCKKYAH